MIEILQLGIICLSIAIAMRLYSCYFIPFASLSTLINFYRFKRQVLKTYSKVLPEKIALDYCNFYRLDNKMYTYGEILVQSFYVILKRANLQPFESFVDLGSGSGKLVLMTAILFECRDARGIEIQPPLHGFAKSLQQQLQHAYPAWEQRLAKAQLELGDYLQLDFFDANVVFTNATCTPPEVWKQLVEKFKALKPGSRIIVSTLYLDAPCFRLCHSDTYAVSWGVVRVSIYERTAVCQEPDPR